MKILNNLIIILIALFFGVILQSLMEWQPIDVSVIEIQKEFRKPIGEMEASTMIVYVYFTVFLFEFTIGSFKDFSIINKNSENLNKKKVLAYLKEQSKDNRERIENYDHEKDDPFFIHYLNGLKRSADTFIEVLNSKVFDSND